MSKYNDPQYEINKKFEKLERQKYGKVSYKNVKETFKGYNQEDVWHFIECIYERDNK